MPVKVMSIDWIICHHLKRGVLLNQYTNLQRIKSAEDMAKEVEYQIRITKAKLEVMGVVAS